MTQARVLAVLPALLRAFAALPRVARVAVGFVLLIGTLLLGLVLAAGLLLRALFGRSRRTRAEPGQRQPGSSLQPDVQPGASHRRSDGAGRIVDVEFRNVSSQQR